MRRSMVAALALGASVASFGLIQNVGAATAATPTPFYGVAEGAKVTISDAAFDPPEVTITAGEAVSWKNAGQQTHHVKADDGTFDSGPIAPGKEWSWPSTKTGTFTYKCTKNPAMAGTVKVNESKDPDAR